MSDPRQDVLDNLRFCPTCGEELIEVDTPSVIPIYVPKAKECVEHGQLSFWSFWSNGNVDVRFHMFSNKSRRATSR